MNTQDVKRYLSQAYYASVRIESLQEELATLEARLQRCTPSYTNGTHGVNHSTFEYTLDRVIQYKERLCKEIDNLVSLTEGVKSAVDMVEHPKAREVLTLRYVNFHTFDYIAVKLGLEKRQVYRLHKNALESLSTIM